MSDDYRERGPDNGTEDAAVERLPADLAAIYDQLTHDADGWARRLPESAPLQGYLRSLAAGTATVDAIAPPEDSAVGPWDGDALSNTGPTPSAPERHAPAMHARPSRRAVWGGAVSAVVIVALLVGAVTLMPGARSTNGLTSAPAPTATPQPASCAPDQITLTLPPHAKLYQIAMTSPTEGWALGDTVNPSDWTENPDPLLVHFHNCTWAPVPTPLPGLTTHLDSISMATADDGWAAGWEISGTVQTCVLLHYTDGQWQRATLPAAIPAQGGRCSKIAMLSPSEGWLLASWGKSQGPLGSNRLLHYAGGAWTLVDSPVNQAFTLSPVGPDDVWVAGMRPPTGGSGMMLVDMGHDQHGQWTMFHLGVGAEATLRMNSPSDGWLMGSPLPQEVLHYDGASWQHSAFSDHAPSPGAIDVLDGNDAWTITTTDHGVDSTLTGLQHYTDGRWQSVAWPFPDDGMLPPLTRVAPGDYWAIGVHPSNGGAATRQWLLLYYVGGQWHEYGA